MSGVNKIVRKGAQAKSLFESAKSVISSAVSIKQGDLVVMDTTGHLLALPALETDGAKFLGVMPVTIVSGKLAFPYSTDVDASQAIQDVPGPQYSCEAKVILKTGDALVPGGLVYLDPSSGTRNVSSTGTKAIGVYQGDNISSATAGQEIVVLIGCRHPSDSLQF